MADWERRLQKPESKLPWLKQDRGYSQSQGGRGSASTSSFAPKYRNPGSYPQTITKERGRNVLKWEKDFCYHASSISWKRLCEAKKMLPYCKNVAEWDDSANKEAFFNAKARFWAQINNLPCNIHLPDPDMYIDEPDWDAQIDPELLLGIDTAKLYVEPPEPPSCSLWGNLNPPPSTGWGDEDPPAATGWGDENLPAATGWRDGKPPAATGWRDGNPPAATGWGDEDLPAATGWGDEDLPAATGWRDGNPPAATGWGDEDLPAATGWGEKNPPAASGWGDKNAPAATGWGDKDAPEATGWGYEHAAEATGWGYEHAAEATGWGYEHPAEASGWGEAVPPAASGWGEKYTQAVSGWGYEDLPEATGWGKKYTPEVTIWGGGRDNWESNSARKEKTDDPGWRQGHNWKSNYTARGGGNYHSINTNNSSTNFCRGKRKSYVNVGGSRASNNWTNWRHRESRQIA